MCISHTICNCNRVTWFIGKIRVVPKKKRYCQVVLGYFLYVTWQISFKTRDLLLSVKPCKEDFLISHVGKRRPRFPASEHWLVIVTLSVNGQKGSRKRTRTCKRSKWMEKGKHRLSAVMGVSGKKEECVSAVESGNGIRSEQTSTNLVLPGNHRMADADFQKYYARLLRNEG